MMARASQRGVFEQFTLQDFIDPRPVPVYAAVNTSDVSYYVLVEWPSGSPWLVMIDATSAADARRAVVGSDVVRRGRGSVVKVERVGSVRSSRRRSSIPHGKDGRGRRRSHRA